jgi:hypothetical protein
LPITIVSATRESFTILAWFITTSMPEPASAAIDDVAARNAARPSDRLSFAIAALQIKEVFNGR